MSLEVMFDTAKEIAKRKKSHKNHKLMRNIYKDYLDKKIPVNINSDMRAIKKVSLIFFKAFAFGIGATFIKSIYAPKPVYRKKREPIYQNIYKPVDELYLALDDEDCGFYYKRFVGYK